MKELNILKEKIEGKFGSFKNFLYICIMESLLYLIVAIFLIAWILGFFVFSAGAFIHLLLIVVVVALVLAIIRRI